MDESDSKRIGCAEDEIGQIIDCTPVHEEIRVNFRLRELQTAAQDAKNISLSETIRCERNVFLAFDDREAFERVLPTLRQFIYTSDIDYLRGRFDATSSPRAKSRYGHAIAAVTKRYDDGQSAARAYLEAFLEYRKRDVTNDPDAFHALHKIMPLAKTICLQYGMIDGFKREALAFLLDGQVHFAHVKTKLFGLIIEDARSFSREDMFALRQFSLDILDSIARGDHEEIIAVAALGRRLADRIGEPHRDWYTGEAAALETRLTFASHPMLVELVGTRLMRLYHLLDNEQKLEDMIVRMRDARAKIEYQTFSAQPDGWEADVALYKTEAQRMVRERGPCAALLWLATNAQLVPSIQRIREHMKEMETGGIGVLRKLATTIVTADERLLTEDVDEDHSNDHETHEQYGIWWTFEAVLPFLIFMGELVPPDYLRLDHVEQFLAQSWIGVEEDVPYGGGEKLPNDLVKLLMSGIRLYFRLLKAEANDDELVPALDTLVMRIEAVVRKLARMLDVPALRPTDRRGRPAVEHASFELLDDDRVAKACGEDLIFFAKHTLLQEPEGLRDRIGHALLHHRQYRMLDLTAALCVYTS